MKPVIFYGRHFAPGVCEYRPKGKQPYKVLIEEPVAKAMDPSFAGCPVYVLHNVNADYDDKDGIDGYVSESFYNPMDGMHWRNS